MTTPSDTNGTKPRSGPIKIGVISACTGDRVDSLLRMISGPIEVDAIVGDYLAELNLAWHAMQYEKNPDAGYDKGFLKAMKLASGKIKERMESGNPIKFAVNAGALNPVQLALDLRQLFDTFGEQGKQVKIAYVSGDNILPQLDNAIVRESLRHLTEKASYAEWKEGKDEVVANVYIGQWGVVKALESGADVVVTGRTTDASCLMALSSWWHRWGEKDYNKHAQTLVTGHMVECGTYVTGGNFCGFKKMGDKYIDLGFPIAEISTDGTTVVTKQPGQNGLVNIDTVRSQLVYEIQGRWYYNPDVIADLGNIQLAEIGKDRVLVTGAKGLPPPETLKASVQAYGGYQAEVNAFAIGLDIEEKGESWGRMTRSILRADEKLRTGEYSCFVTQLIGRSEQNPRSQNAATAHCRIMAQGPNAETFAEDNFINPIIENLISAFPGFTPDLEYPRTGLPKPYMTYFPGLISRHVLEKAQVHFLNKSPSIRVPHASEYIDYAELPRQEDYEPTSPFDLSSFGETVEIPLGYQIYARSGDKGANVNVGFFPQGDSQEEWDWLRSFMSTETIKELLGEDAKSVIRYERVEFPKIHAVHFVLVGILGDGVNCTPRVDALGKGIGEYLRAKFVPYPKKLYRGYDGRI